MAPENGFFKRINFFRGFLTTENDWNDAEAYHFEKQKLHNKMFHGPGVVGHYGGALRVTARGRNELAAEIATGYAIDGRGHDIWVPEPEIKLVIPKDFKLPQTVYLVLRYIEEPTDYVAYKENPEYKGHKRIEEKYKIDFTNIPPDIEREIELCRIALTEDPRRISDARDPMNPGPNEIDLRFVPFAGVVGPFLDPMVLFRIRRMVDLCRGTYAFLFHDLDIRRAGDVLYCFYTLDMLILIRQVDIRSFIEMNASIMELQQDLIAELDERHPQHASTREFLNFKNPIRYLEQLYGEDKPERELVEHIIGYQTKACEALEGLHAPRIERHKPGQLEAASPEALWEQVKIRSQPFEKELVLDSNKFLLADEVDVLHSESEKAHGFEIREYKDMYRSRQAFKYPDTEEGTVVRDEGIAFEGGFAEFTIHNVKVKRQLILVFRIDYTHGEWQAGMLLNGKKAADWVVTGRDRKFRWRNWPFIISGDAVEEDTVHVRVEFKKAERDVNMFHIWAYQPA